MSRSPATAPARAALPSIGAGSPGLVKLAAVLIGTGVLAASSWMHVPMYPVPMTLQTLAVLLIGAAFGARLAVITVLVWLAEAALGLPVLAGGGFGVASLAGPTGGYLAGFAVSAGLVGWFARGGWLGASTARTFALLLLADAAIFALGCLWLAHFTGLRAAWAGGVVPFVPGDLLKVGLATAVLHAARPLLRGRAV